jgi:hypothetical protein
VFEIGWTCSLNEEGNKWTQNFWWGNCEMTTLKEREADGKKKLGCILEIDTV